MTHQILCCATFCHRRRCVSRLRGAVLLLAAVKECFSWCSFCGTNNANFALFSSIAFYFQSSFVDLAVGLKLLMSPSPLSLLLLKQDATVVVLLLLLPPPFLVLLFERDTLIVLLIVFELNATVVVLSSSSSSSSSSFELDSTLLLMLHSSVAVWLAIVLLVVSDAIPLSGSSELERNMCGLSDLKNWKRNCGLSDKIPRTGR